MSFGFKAVVFPGVTAVACRAAFHMGFVLGPQYRTLLDLRCIFFVQVSSSLEYSGTQSLGATPALCLPHAWEAPLRPQLALGNGAHLDREEPQLKTT